MDEFVAFLQHPARGFRDTLDARLLKYA
jgi:hypothetical protein